jgi:taurine dioxygenase
MPFRFLYCVKTADDETSVTSWFDQCWLYNNIPEDLRAYVETLEANFKAPYKTWWYDNTIPFVLADPIDGKKAVSLQKMFFRHFKGLGKVESDAIVDQLLKIALAEENVYRHEWAVGDLILSNNYNTAHKREAMLTKQERTLWRTTFQIPELIPHEIKPRAF